MARHRGQRRCPICQNEIIFSRKLGLYGHANQLEAQLFINRICSRLTQAKGGSNGRPSCTCGAWFSKAISGSTISSCLLSVAKCVQFPITNHPVMVRSTSFEEEDGLCRFDEITSSLSSLLIS
jgi:hypothetical protein